MAVIPNKSEGQSFSATEVFKIVDAVSEITSSSGSEVTVVTHTIGAGTLTSIMQVMASIHFEVASGSNVTGTFRLKIGPTGSELTKQTIVLEPAATGQTGGMLLFTDTTQTFSSEITVLITFIGTTGSKTATVFHSVVSGV